MYYYVIFVLARCPDLPLPANGQVFYLNKRKIAIFYCNSCYDIKGPPILTCVGGRWNLPPPKCVKVC